MAQIFDAPSKAILRSQIAEHIAETDKNDKRELQAGEEPLPNDRFFDRELSWLKFNKRVLELAQDEDLPIIERASFAAIFANNLDEFFMVRVAGLKRRIDTGIAVTAASGLSPRQQLRAISEQAHRLQDEHAHYMIDHILPDLAKEQIVLLSWDKLTAAEQERLSRYYRQQVFPVLTPLAVDPAHPFPYISGGSINLAVLVENPASGKSHFARVKIPGNLNRLVPVDDMTDDDATNVRYGFITMENLIIAHLESLFPGMIIKEARSFRVTRNEDIDVEEDDAENLLNAMEKELLRRRFGPPIRLEISDETSPFLSQLLADQLRVSADEVYRLPAPLDATVLFELGGIDRPDLKYRSFVPTTNRQIAEVESSRAQDIFAAIRERDYPSASPVRFVLYLRSGVPSAGCGGSEGARHQADVVPYVQQLPDHRRAHRRGACGQAGAGTGRNQGTLRRRRQHRMGTQAGTRRRARGVRHRGPEDPLQAEPCGASGSRRPAPLLPCGHR